MEEGIEFKEGIQCHITQYAERSFQFSKPMFSRSCSCKVFDIELFEHFEKVPYNLDALGQPVSEFATSQLSPHFAF